MGTDSLRLFDKARADRVMVQGPDELALFIQENLEDNLARLEREPFGLRSAVESAGGSVRTAIDSVLESEGISFERLRGSVAECIGLGQEEMALDYWACYVAVFAGAHPGGSISSLDYLPDETEERFLLLRADHIEQMLRSLEAHRQEIQPRIMSASDIERLGRWRDICRREAGMMAAYFFDL